MRPAVGDVVERPPVEDLLDDLAVIDFQAFAAGDFQFAGIQPKLVQHGRVQAYLVYLLIGVAFLAAAVLAGGAR